MTAIQPEVGTTVGTGFVPEMPAVPGARTEVRPEIDGRSELAGDIPLTREPAGRRDWPLEVPARSETPNAEWELSELVDAVTGELRRAAARIAADVRGAGPKFAPARVELELGVRVRKEADGRVLFRTDDVGEPESVLRLDFSRVARVGQAALGAGETGWGGPDEQGTERPLATVVEREPVSATRPDVADTTPLRAPAAEPSWISEREVDLESEETWELYLEDEPELERQELTGPTVSLDPLLHMLDQGPDDIVAKVFAGLLRVDPESGALVPAAGEFVGGEPDHMATVVELRLRRGLRFHDGSLVTGEDVKFTYDMAREMEESPWQWFVEQYVMWIEAEGECVWFGLTVPFARVPSALWTIGIVPERAYGSDEFERRPVGCGARTADQALPIASAVPSLVGARRGA